MQIPLSQIHPNPYRDFDLHPIDPAQVDRLKASMDLDGFWASVVARKVARWLSDGLRPPSHRGRQARWA
jgi:ParB-like chromosome segregation protein Spo0J